MQQPLRADHAASNPHAAAGAFRAVPLVLALAIAAAFAAILLGTVDFPLRTHADEPSKALAVITHRNNYAHPILMLELVRAANAFAGLADQQAVVELGRAIAVLIGAASIVATFLLAREALPAPAALAATAATAMTPLVAMHARFLKEDIFVLLFILLSLLALIRTLKSPTTSRALLLGAAIGLAAAAKYVGIVLVPFAAAVLLLGLPELDRRKRLRLMGKATLAGLAAFALLHLPVLWEFRQFAGSVYGNLLHAEAGDSVRAPLPLTYGLFPLRQSLLPGLGAPARLRRTAARPARTTQDPARHRRLRRFMDRGARALAAQALSEFPPLHGAGGAASDHSRHCLRL